MNYSKTLNINILYFYSQIGNNYYRIVLPFIALFFSNNINELKATIPIFFFFTAILQLFPEVLTRKYGSKNAILYYFAIFLAGTLLGLFYQGSVWIIALSRVLQAIGLSALPILIKSMMFQEKKNIKRFMIYRELLAIISGPILTILLGFVLHFYNWQLCYLIIFFAYSLALIWLYYNLPHNLYKNSSSSSIRQQLIKTLSIIHYPKTLYLMISNILSFSITILIQSVYAFIFLHDFKTPIYYIGFIPLLFSMAFLPFLKLLTVFQNISTVKKVTFIISLQLIVGLFYLRAPLTELNTLIYWSILSILGSLNYILSNQLLGHRANEIKLTTQVNIFYYFLRNAIPTIITWIWAQYGQGTHSDMVPELILFLSLTSLVIFALYLKSRGPDSMSRI